jgi:hypothetical protein
MTNHIKRVLNMFAASKQYKKLVAINSAYLVTVIGEAV